MKENGIVAEKMQKNKKENDSYRAHAVDFSQSSNSFADRVLFLQRTIGNNAVERLIRSGILQAKLRVQQPEAILQRGLATTPARSRSPFPGNVINAWAGLNAANNPRGALKVIVAAMERRGEIDTRLMQIQVVPGRPICAGSNPYILDRNVNGAFTRCRNAA